MSVILICGDGNEFEFSYPLTAEEQSTLRDKMDAYCLQQNGVSLEEMRAAYLQEQSEDTPEFQM